MGQIILAKGDICQRETEAMVNAANNELLHGGGVAGAIVKVGGSVIQEESNKIGPIPLGEAAITSAGKLKAKYIIHAASMKLGELAEEENVKNAITNSFIRAQEAGVKKIAFPAIGAGIGRFPLARCAELSFEIASEFVPKFEEIVFVLFSDEAYAAFKKVFIKSDK